MIYGQFMTHKLSEKVHFNKQAIEEWSQVTKTPLNYEKIKNAKTTFEFDQLFTFKVFFRAFLCP